MRSSQQPPQLSSSSVQEATKALGQRLREIRRNAGLTARALAQQADWHKSKCSRFESGSRRPSETDLRAWALHCGVPELAEELVTTARGIEGMYVEWRRMEQTGLRHVQESVLPLWERTRRFRIYSSWLIPGPVQTAAYIEALLRSLRDRRRLVDDVEQAVRVRVDKQRVLREGDHRFAILLEESVLRHRIGGPEVMAGQLRHLLETASLPSVSLGVIPMTADRTKLWPVEGFFLFDEAEVSVELVSAHLSVKQSQEIGMYVQVFSDLSELAIYGSAAKELISAAIESLQ
ncbi:helix-turn-helix transcriptional regulator [Streptomyces sp. NBC_01498]|uniref:helix-turn-helix domain-containing protein n=1 Tax=Streptomyces sp. NBC_01498 TaxID=2975870 RepID=UPI002E7B01BD|nr:helix-turn-helix transcriptional regulator [Streptomyces sp. NBC_01498]WTL26306.1 helix-turn-helix transcriptional regulator [Streptomyces sp. NBC_01498]